MDNHPTKLKNRPQIQKRENFFQEFYDFNRLIKVKENRYWLEKFDPKVNRRKKHLRDPLEIDEKVIVLAELLRKKHVPGRLYKSTTENKTFFNRDRAICIKKSVC